MPADYCPISQSAARRIRKSGYALAGSPLCTDEAEQAQSNEDLVRRFVEACEAFTHLRTGESCRDRIGLLNHARVLGAGS